MSRNALIFDVDGVLADTEGPASVATQRMFREVYGATIAPETFEPYIGTGARRYVEGAAADHGIEIDIEFALAKRFAFFQEIVQDRDIAFPGVRDLIAAFAADPNWTVGVATSSPGEKSRRTMEAARIDTRVFAAYIHGDCVEHLKPAPDIYLIAAEGLGIEPRRCVVIEDSYQGVTAAKTAGMACIAVEQTFRADKLSHADLVLPTMRDVRLGHAYDLLAHHAG